MLFKFVPGGFLRSDALEQFEFKVKKKPIGIQKPKGKFKRNSTIIIHLHYLAPAHNLIGNFSKRFVGRS